MSSPTTSEEPEVKNSKRRSEYSKNLLAVTNCCLFCLIPLILVVSAIGVLLNFTISVAPPSCSVTEFYVAALDKSVKTTTRSNIIFFKVNFVNLNALKGIQYSPLNLTVYYGSDNSFPVGNYIVPSFYQTSLSDELPIVKSEVVSTRGVPWKAAIDLVSNGSTVSFRVGMDATIRFKYLDVILNKKHKMVVGATVKVDDSGESKPVRFKSGAATSPHGDVWVGLTAVVFIAIFYLV